MGFEPTPPKRTELESVALDHSATDALFVYLFPVDDAVCYIKIYYHTVLLSYTYNIYYTYAIISHTQIRICEILIFL